MHACGNNVPGRVFDAVTVTVQDQWNLVRNVPDSADPQNDVADSLVRRGRRPPAPGGARRPRALSAAQGQKLPQNTR